MLHCSRRWLLGNVRKIINIRCRGTILFADTRHANKEEKSTMSEWLLASLASLEKTIGTDRNGLERIGTDGVLGGANGG